jgi:hypothetical protein
MVGKTRRFSNLINFISALIRINGGEDEIRTHETVARLHTFQACAFNHSATSPQYQIHLPERLVVEAGFHALKNA